VVCARFFFLFFLSFPKKVFLIRDELLCSMPLDIQAFREDQGGDLKKLKESQRSRFHEEKLIDEICDLDSLWRRGEPRATDCLVAHVHLWVCSGAWSVFFFLLFLDQAKKENENVTEMFRMASDKQKSSEDGPSQETELEMIISASTLDINEALKSKILSLMMPAVKCHQ